MRRTCLLLALCCLSLALAGCFGTTIHWPWEAGGAVTSGGKPVAPTGPREDFAALLTQLQWVFIGLGIAGVVASIWVPIISTRHAVGAIAVGLGVALVKPFVIALYWPTIICLGLAALAAVWPYAVAVYTWARARFTGKPGPVGTVGIIPSIKTLFMARAQAVGQGVIGMPVGTVAVAAHAIESPMKGTP